MSPNNTNLTRRQFLKLSGAIALGHEFPGYSPKEQTPLTSTELARRNFDRMMVTGEEPYVGKLEHELGIVVLPLGEGFSASSKSDARAINPQTNIDDKPFSHSMSASVRASDGRTVGLVMGCNVEHVGLGETAQTLRLDTLTIWDGESGPDSIATKVFSGSNSKERMSLADKDAWGYKFGLGLKGDRLGLIVLCTGYQDTDGIGAYFIGLSGRAGDIVIPGKNEDTAGETLTVYKDSYGKANELPKIEHHEAVVIN